MKKIILCLIIITLLVPKQAQSQNNNTAAIGAMVLAHHQREVPRSTQRDLSEQRFRSGSLATAAGLPGPGVFARHNAVDVPALLPTGQAAPTSISKVLQARGDMIESSTFEMKKDEEEEK